MPLSFYVYMLILIACILILVYLILINIYFLLFLYFYRAIFSFFQIILSLLLDSVKFLLLLLSSNINIIAILELEYYLYLN